MSQSKSQFFKGAAIVAQYALPETSPRLLNRDAANLASLSAKQFEGIEMLPADETTSLAFAWLDHRRRKPHGSLDPEILIESAGEIHYPALDVARISVVETGKIFPDKSFSSLLSGAQSSLSLLQPESTAKLFVDDSEVLRHALPDLETLYLSNGIPDEAIPELLVHQYASYRLANPGLKLKLFSGGLGTTPVVGMIYVTTDPSPADIWVDKVLMTNPSPAWVFASVGTRKVKGVKGTLRAEKDVTVVVSSTVNVSLKLV
jgi:hypothetical protein